MEVLVNIRDISRMAKWLGAGATEGSPFSCRLTSVLTTTPAIGHRPCLPGLSFLHLLFWALPGRDMRYNAAWLSVLALAWVARSFYQGAKMALAARK